VTASMTSSRPKARLPSWRSGLPVWRPSSAKLRPNWRRLPESVLWSFLNGALFWQLQTYDDQRIVLDDWQIALLNNPSRLIFLEKAPQIGFSWAMALSGLHECLFYQDSYVGYVSVSLSEAREKILVARKAWEQLPEVFQRECPLLKANESELWFGSEARPSRLVSLPATASMRGRALTKVVLDEMDFYKDGGEQAFRIAIGRIARGGKIVGGSTCFGQGTTLDKIVSRDVELEEASKASVGRIPYYAAENLEALQTALLAMATLTADEFEEEYECVRGALGDTFPASMVHAATHEEDEWTVEDGFLCEPDVDDEGVGWRRIETSAPMVLGVDVGQTKNPTIGSLLVKEGSQWIQHAVLAPNEDGHPLSLPQQQRWLASLLDHHRSLKVVVDAIGIGAGPAEALLEKFGDDRVLLMVAGIADPTQKLSARAAKKVRRRDLPPTDKYSLTVELKVGMEAGELMLLGEREQAKQLKATKLKTGHTVEQPGSRRKTHYDRFWALAYSWWGVRALRGSTGSPYNRRGLLVAGGKGNLSPGAAFRSTWQENDRNRFFFGLLRNLSRGQAIPWETLADEEAEVLDRMLATRANRLTDVGRDLEAVVMLEERRRWSVIRSERAAEDRDRSTDERELSRV